MNEVRGYILKGRVIDGSLNPPVERGAVVVEGERIAWVGESSALPPAYADSKLQVIDLPGRTILPGLVDGHTHISFGEARSEEENALYTPVEFRTAKAIYYAKKVLQAGVTSAFDAATTYNVAQAVRDAIDSGMFEGPRFSVSGKQLTNHQGLEDSFPSEMQFPPGQSAVLVKYPHDLVEEIRRQVKDEVDAIKVSGSNDSLITPDSLGSSAFTFEEFKIVADESHRLGRICGVHARSRESALFSAKAGFDNLFHASYIDDEGIEGVPEKQCRHHADADLAGQPRRGEAVASRRFRDRGLPGGNRRGVGELRKAYEAGVTLIAGSESGWSPVPYGQWHAREMEIFVKLLGMTPLQAIHANTLAATRLFPRFGDQIGKLEAGRLADILVVPGNPSDDVSILQRPSSFDYIFKGGMPIDRTPPPPRRRMWYERTKIFLNGLYEFDEKASAGRLVS